MGGRDSRLGALTYSTVSMILFALPDMLTRLRAVDGSGSGVDADRLDGLDSSEFIRTAAEVLASRTPSMASTRASMPTGLMVS